MIHAYSVDLRAGKETALSSNDIFHKYKTRTTLYTTRGKENIQILIAAVNMILLWPLFISILFTGAMLCTGGMEEGTGKSFTVFVLSSNTSRWLIYGTDL